MLSESILAGAQQSFAFGKRTQLIEDKCFGHLRNDKGWGNRAIVI